MLCAIPAVLIIAAGLYGSRPEERRLLVVIGAGATIAFIPCLLIAQSTDRTVAAGFAYALMVVGATQWAMLFGRRRGQSDEGGGRGPDGGEPTEPSPVDWPDFERRLWDEVRKSQPRRPPPRERRPRAPV